MDSTLEWRLRHLPALDGIRGVAILLVLVSHSVAFHLTRGGATTGVTLFFVLSGFLITALLAQERRDTGRIDLWAFYRRRALRLLPALVLLILALVTLNELATHWVATTTQLPHPLSSGDVLATLFYSANWLLLFGHHHSLGLLSQCWSLSVEEQFYLAWPTLLIAGVLLFGLKSRRLLGAVLALAALSASEGAWLYWRTSGRAGGRVYQGTDTRADSLLLGATLALWMVSGRRLRVPAALFLLGLGLIAFCTYSANPVVAKVPILATIGGVIMIGGLLQRGWASAMFSWAPLCWTGRISYGLYLWHLPIISFLYPHFERDPRIVQLALYALVSYAAAVASYYLVERHFLRLKSRSARVAEPVVAGGLNAAA